MASENKRSLFCSGFHGNLDPFFVLKRKRRRFHQKLRMLTLRNHIYETTDLSNFNQDKQQGQEDTEGSLSGFSQLFTLHTILYKFTELYSIRVGTDCPVGIPRNTSQWTEISDICRVNYSELRRYTLAFSLIRIMDRIHW